VKSGYGVIYADPPWHFQTWSAKGRGRCADAWYDTMSVDDIKMFPASAYAATDCVLLLWAIDPMLDVAFDVISAWGFKYKTVGFYWVKTSASGAEFMGLGRWTRMNPEVCLLATKGNPKRLCASVRKLVTSPRREHSRKPDVVYDRIEQLVVGPYLELFARNLRQGWDSLGDEANSGPGIRRWRSDMRKLRQRVFL
jgi:N6-adenosine-specific RNA methylase IME4